MQRECCRQMNILPCTVGALNYHYQAIWVSVCMIVWLCNSLYVRVFLLCTGTHLRLSLDQWNNTCTIESGGWEAKLPPPTEIVILPSDFGKPLTCRSAPY